MIKGNHTDAAKSYYQPPFVLHSRDTRPQIHTHYGSYEYENERM